LKEKDLKVGFKPFPTGAILLDVPAESYKLPCHPMRGRCAEI
jgi:hypothetical protein